MTESLGRRLRQAREARGLSLREVTEAIRIRGHLIEALETDNYAAMTSAAQARGFLKLYAAYLDLDLDEALRRLQDAADEPQAASQVAGTEVVGPLPEAPAPAGFRRLQWLTGRTRKQVEDTRLDAPVTVAETSPPEAASGPQSPGTRVEAEPSATDVTAGSDVSVEAAAPRPSFFQTLETRAREALESAARAIALAILRRSSRQGQEGSELPEAGPGAASEVAAAETATPRPTAASDEILAGIGTVLREKRELMGLTTDEIEKHIHIRAAVLSALEEGVFDRLPSTVQTRGMLSNYASFLGLDTDPILLRFADALQARHREKYPDRPHAGAPQEARPAMPPLRAFVAPDLLFGAGIVIVLIGLGIWGARRLTTRPVDQPSLEYTAPSIPEVLAGTDQPMIPGAATPVVTQLPLFISATPEPELSEAPTLEGDANIRLMVVAVERTFMRVTVDGEEAFSGRVQPGTSYPFDGEDQVEVLTGNGAALRITFNGRDIGLMGTLGEVVSTIFTPNGIATPTPTVPPTPTLTPRVTVTPTPTLTLTPTPIRISSAP